VEGVQKLFDEHLSKKTNRIAEVKNRIATNEEKIKRLQEEIDSLTATIQQDTDIPTTDVFDSKVDKVREKMNEILRATSKLQHERDFLQREINKIQEKPSNCPTCGHAYSEEDLSKNREELLEKKAQIEEFQVEIEKKSAVQGKLQEIIAKLRVERDAATQRIQAFQYKIAQKNQSERTIKEYRENIDQLQKDIEHIDSEDVSFTSSLQKLQIELEELRGNVSRLNKRVEILDVSRKIVSEEGVRSFIVKKILKVMNSRLAYYLKKLDANTTCVFDSYFQEILVDEKGRECSYYNFSSGERKRIDLAILFTFQDIRRLQADVSVNLSVYDELLDSSLDKQGIKQVMKILEERVEKYNECVYIVTHRPDAVDSVSGEIVYLEKENGITRIASAKKI
jgi:DNA repair exonuclease SbcCD ATPase subunit